MIQPTAPPQVVLPTALGTLRILCGIPIPRAGLAAQSPVGPRMTMRSSQPAPMSLLYLSPVPQPTTTKLRAIINVTAETVANIVTFEEGTYLLTGSGLSANQTIIKTGAAGYNLQRCSSPILRAKSRFRVVRSKTTTRVCGYARQKLDDAGSRRLRHRPLRRCQFPLERF